MGQEEFRKHITPMYGQLIRYASRYLNSKEDTEDAVQEALIRLWNIRERLPEYRSKEALAREVVKNICIDKIRAHKYTSDLHTAENINDTEYNPHQTAEINDSIKIIHTLIKKLPTLQQSIMHMKDIEGYEIREIADIIHAEPEAVRVNLSRARKKVRDEYIRIQQKGNNT